MLSVLAGKQGTSCDLANNKKKGTSFCALSLSLMLKARLA